jgi:RNA polymerase subunit RPABC4/transcription elongation factor Spt4
MIINQEFAALVQEYLTDGIISPTERKVLLKKAVAMGIDEDEAACYIEAQEQKLEQKMERERINEKGRKCPHCHQIIDQFSDVCPICNTPLTPQLTDKFNTLLKNLEDALYNLKTGENIDGAMALIDQYTREAKFNFGNHKKVLAILGEIEAESKRIAENKAVNEIITNLEEALIALKSGKNINGAKAIIDRYARKAKSEYADNVKVCMLLAEIEVEAKNAEAKAKKAESKAKKAAVVDAIKKYFKEHEAERNMIIFCVSGFAIMFVFFALALLVHCAGLE